MLRRDFLTISSALAAGSGRLRVAGIPVSPANSVLDYGAVPDGKTLNTVSLQRSIDNAFHAGGGVVYVPPGTYLSGGIEMKSRVTLYLEAGATLLGSPSLDDYQPHAGPPVNGDANQRHLIFAQNAEDITLAGPGRVDGQGEAFWEPHERPPLPRDQQKPTSPAPHWKKKPRPSPMLEFVGCRGLRIQDLRIENSPGWTIRPINCDDVHIAGISIRNPIYGPNTDGIDITGCQNVFISDCSIDTGDDAICLKSENPYGAEPRLTRNVVVTNCVLTTCCNGFKIGTATRWGLENITFSNSVVYSRSDEFQERVIAGVALEVVDGGWIDGVVVTGIRMQRARTPIFIRLGDRHHRPGNSQQRLRGVAIENIHATDALIASSITGLLDSFVEDVAISNIRVDSPLPCRPEWVRRTVSEIPNDYPEARMFGMLPASGLYVRHVRDLRLGDVSFSATPNEARPTIIFDDVNRARISGLQTTPIAGAMPVVQMIQSRDIWVTNSAAPPGTAAFAGIEGERAENILFSANDLRGAKTPLEVSKDVPEQAVTLSCNTMKMSA